MVPMGVTAGMRIHSRLNKYEISLINCNQPQDQGKIKEIEKRLGQVQSENERLNKTLKQFFNEIQKRERTEEVQSLKQQVQNYFLSQTDLAKQKEVEAIVSSYKNEIDRLQSILRSKDDEISEISKGFTGGNSGGQSDSSQLDNIRQQFQVKEENYKSQLSQKDDEISRLRQKLEELSKQGSADQISQLNQELDSWKQRFQKASRDHSRCQEELIIAQTELEQYKKEKQSITERKFSNNAYSSSSSSVGVKKDFQSMLPNSTTSAPTTNIGSTPPMNYTSSHSGTSSQFSSSNPNPTSQFSSGVNTTTTNTTTTTGKYSAKKLS